MGTNRNRIHGLIAAAILVLAFHPGGFSARAQGIIREIEVREAGGDLLDPAEILGFVGPREGQRYNPDKVSRAVRHLLDSGRFSFVQVAIQPVEEDVILLVEIRRRERLSRPVEVSGNEHFRDARIRDWLELDPGDYVDEQVLSTRCLRLRSEYEKAGFPDVRIASQIVSDEDSVGTAGAEVTIDEGGRIRSRKLVFEGAEEIPESEIRRITRPKTWWNPFSWFGARIRDDQEIENIRLAVRDLYLNRGYLDAEVTGPYPASDGKSLRFEVSEGRLYTIREVGVSGAEDFPAEQLKALLPPLTGKTASRANIQAGEMTLREHYGAHGYADTRIYAAAEPAADAFGEVMVRYRVREGVPAWIRRVEIRGNSRTRDKVIRRELLLRPGDLFNDVLVRRSENRLRNMGYFEDVRSFSLSGALPDQRDLVFELEEKRTGQFMIGVGFSSIDRMLGFLELSQGNFDIANWPYFTGGGQKMRLSVQAGERRSSFAINFTEPWFLDRRLALSVDAYRRERSYSEFDDLRTGGAVGLTRGFPGIGRVGLRYTLERVELSDLPKEDYVFADEPERTFRFDSQESDYLANRLRLSWSDDTRNRWFVPTRGRLVTAFAGVVVDGGFALYETGMSFKQYFPLLFGHVLSLKGRWEVIESFEEEFVPLAERLYVGGGRTLRGFDYREVGPKVIHADPEFSNSYRPIGGQSMATASAEYSVPILEKLRVAGFCDAGNAWEDSFEFDPSDLAVSAGMGVRLDIPGFPIRIDYAWPLRYDDDLTGDRRWSIWIGYD